MLPAHYTHCTEHVFPPNISPPSPFSISHVVGVPSLYLKKRVHLVFVCGPPPPIQCMQDMYGLTDCVDGWREWLPHQRESVYGYICCQREKQTDSRIPFVSHPMTVECGGRWYNHAVTTFVFTWHCVVDMDDETDL